jgi:hypothetical protein
MKNKAKLLSQQGKLGAWPINKSLEQAISVSKMFLLAALKHKTFFPLRSKLNSVLCINLFIEKDEFLKQHIVSTPTRGCFDQTSRFITAYNKR